MNFILRNTKEFKNKLQHYLFISEETGEKRVLTIESILVNGIPIDSNKEKMVLSGCYTEEDI